MTTIKIIKNTNIDSIEINGHTGYDEFGKDIVCSSISSIVITTVNALIRLDELCVSYETRDGYMKITVLKHNDIIDLLLTNMLDELKALEKKYQKNIKIYI